MRIPPIIICLETFDLISETVKNSHNCVPDSSCEKKFNIQKVLDLSFHVFVNQTVNEHKTKCSGYSNCIDSHLCKRRSQHEL